MGLAVLSLAATMLSACGSTASSNSAAAGTTTSSTPNSQNTQGTTSSGPTASLATLYNKAKAEGTVTWEVGSPVTQYKPLVDAFEHQYPGITVNMINVQGTQVAGQVISEGSKIDYTLITTSAGDVVPLINDKLVAKEDWTKYGIPSTKVVMDGYLLHVYDFAIGWFYNTQKLAKAAAPQSFTQVIKSTWQGDKVGINAQDVFAIEGNYVDGTWSKTKYIEEVRAMKAQNWPQVLAGATLLQDVASGQYELGLTALAQIPIFVKTKGAPLAIAPISPITAQIESPVVLTNAHHPAAAELLAVYLASKPAEKLWSTTIGRGLLSPCTASYLAQMVCKAGAKVDYIRTLAQAQRYQEALTLNKQVFKAT